jgi:hypothetical protein
MNEAEQRALLDAWSVLDDVMTEPDCFDPRKVSLGTRARPDPGGNR